MALNIERFRKVEGLTTGYFVSNEPVLDREVLFSQLGEITIKSSLLDYLTGVDNGRYVYSIKLTDITEDIFSTNYEVNHYTQLGEITEVLVTDILLSQSKSGSLLSTFEIFPEGVAPKFLATLKDVVIATSIHIKNVLYTFELDNGRLPEDMPIILTSNLDVNKELLALTKGKTPQEIHTLFKEYDGYCVTDEDIKTMTKVKDYFISTDNVPESPEYIKYKEVYFLNHSNKEELPLYVFMKSDKVQEYVLENRNNPTYSDIVKFGYYQFSKEMLVKYLTKEELYDLLVYYSGI